MGFKHTGVFPEQAVNWDFAAEKIKKEAAVPTGAVGLITSAEQAEEILQNEKADLIFLGRELLRSTYFSLEKSPKLMEEVAWPKQYERAKPRN